MKLVLRNASILSFTCLWLLPMMVGSASAHRVNVFAWVEGDTVYVESKFAGGKKVKDGKIVVTDPRGVELLSGRTNDQGEFSLQAPKATDLKIVLIAGQGHRGEWTVRAAEIAGIPSKTASHPRTENARPPDQGMAVPSKSPEAETAAPDTVVKPQELEAVIDSILDKKLKPIIRMLADMRQKGPSVGDIFAGIGYIFGLVGIAAYIHSRKKEK